MAEIKLPWGAWYGDRVRAFSIPDSWQVTQFDLLSEKRIKDSELAEKLNLLGNDLQFKKPKNIIIVVDDLTRPVLLDSLLKSMLEKIAALGYTPEKVKILIGLGSHKGLDEEALLKKLGPFAVANYLCINHDPVDTIDIDVVWGKTPIKLNRHYVEAGYKIVISGLTPHSFAGFSGGAKMLFPGLADMDTIAKTHKSVLMGFMGKLGDVEQNKFRSIIEEFVRNVGLDFFIGVVINADRSIRNIHCGDYINAHRNAAKEARDYYLTKIDEIKEPFDAVILNAYPKDSELLQAENAFIPIKSTKTNFLKEDASVAVTSACSEGMGYHGLFGPGGVLYRNPRPLRFLKGHPVTFFSQNVSEEEFYKLYSAEYHFINEEKALIQKLADKLTGNARIAVFPYASLQLTD